LVRDPNLSGAVWAFKDDRILRTDGVSTYTKTISDFPGLDPQSDQFKGLVVDAQGIVWIGSNTINVPQNSALIRLDPASGEIKIFRNRTGWRFPGEYLMPLAATPDGRIWMQYDSDYLTAQRGLCWFDGTSIKKFPAPPFGDPQWGGLPHAAIMDLEVKPLDTGYELWMSCASRGIAVLNVQP
jgi:streptogramin lyase